MKRYYIEMSDIQSEEYVFQSKWFKTPRTAEKWLAENVDYIDFVNLYVNILYADFDEEENYDDIKRYSYIDAHIFANLKQKYTKGEKK